MVAVALSGCSGHSSSSTTGGDCTARVRYHGTVYTSPITVNDAAPMGAAHGSGDLIDCDGKTFETPTLNAVKGVDPAVAVAVGNESTYHGVYVSEDVPEARWPSQVKASP
jgi:hypothetical protein